jgi:iron complex transport system ATP-binding protein
MKHAASMMKLLRRAADELGKTVVLVLHDINFASCYSNHIVAMRNGKVAHQGTPDELIHPEILSDIYDMDIAVEIIGGKRIGVYYL